MGLMLLALPLAVTAATSAHALFVDSNPITIDVQSEVESGIGLARVHTVALNRNGAVEGRIASIDATSNTQGLSSLKIFFVQDGKVINESVTEADGTFVAQVPEGVYSFVASGENGFAAYGVKVVADAEGKFDNVMEAAAVSPRFDAVKKILNDKLPAEVAQQIIDSSSVSSEKVVGSNRVQLAEGQLKGHVVSMLGGKDSTDGTYVHIIQNDKAVAEVQADQSGSFMVQDLEPGIYDFVAAGPSGFAAVSFEAVEAPQEFMDPIAYQDMGSVPFDGGYSDSLDVCLTCSQDSGFVGEQLDYAGTEYYSDPGYVDYGATADYAPIEYAGESIGCGCASGGSCGSSGNFGGFSSCNSCAGGNGGGLFRGGRLGAGGGGLLGGGGGGLLGGGGGIGRLALLGGLAVGIVSIADSGPAESSPITP